MANAQYRWIHECEKPDVPMDITADVYYVRKLPFFRKKKIVNEVVKSRYSTIIWTCEECGSKWEWSAYGETGFWLCRNRPDVYKDIEL